MGGLNTGESTFSPCANLQFCVQIPVQALVQFVEALENGYSKHKNPYHNLIHAADVTQTAHFLMLHTGLMVTHTHMCTSFCGEPLASLYTAVKINQILKI